VPPLRRIGQDWHDGQLTISVEHRAAAIIDRLLGELAPNPRGRRRGTAVVASVSGDQHSLPTSMATVALREANWHVHHLGADMPGDELLRFCKEHAADLAVISLTNPEATVLAHETADRLRAQGTTTIVGAPGMTLTNLVEQARTATTMTKPAGAERQRAADNRRRSTEGE
jgi:MerR family transcriptional regulator, light-induced transcriptional regulator